MSIRPGKFLPLLLLTAISCVPGEEDQFAIFTQSYDFNLSTWGWEPGFTDYPVGQPSQADSIYNWDANYSASPLLGGNHMALKLSCDNESEDIFMFIKRKVGGLQPNTSYSLVFTVDVVSDANLGDGMLLKAGASFVEPQKVIHNNRYELNLDKGENFQSGDDLFLLGRLDAPFDQSGYLYTSFNNAMDPRRFTAKTNNVGEIWLIVGTESSAAGINTIFFSKIQIIFSASN
jgi:hypothetical protein